MPTKTLLIGIDGVLLDVLLDVDAPHLQRLIRDGRLWRSQLYPTIPAVGGAPVRDTLAGTRVESGPGWASILTGVWPDRHGVRDNTFGGSRFDVFPSVLDRIVAARGDDVHTAAFASWDPLVTDTAGGPVITDAVDVRFGVRAETGLGYVLGDVQVTAAATAHLRDGDPDVVFVYLGGVDEAGHASRADGPEYRASIELVDRHVGALLSAVATDDWLVLVTTDHGRLPDGSHGEPSDAERESFVIASVADAPDTDFLAVDIASTILARHGIPAVGEPLDGVARLQR